MIKTKSFLLSSVVLFSLGIMPAMADMHEKGDKPQRQTMFEKQDANKDGMVSEDEFVSYSKMKFGEIDANKDGNISMEESKAHREKKKEKWADKKEEMKKEMKEKAQDKMKEKTAPAAP